MQEWAEGHAVAERWEVGQVSSDDAVRVVGGAREGETDGHGRRVEGCDDAVEPLDHRGQTAVEVGGVGRQGYGVDDEAVCPDCAEYEVGAAGIERDDGAVIVSVHSSAVLD